MSGAVQPWTENQPLDLVQVREGVLTVGNPRFREFWEGGVAGAYLPPLLHELAHLSEGRSIRGVRDDNRSALLPEFRLRIGEREFVANVKGVGAGFDAFQPRRLSLGILREICHDSDAAGLLEGREGEVPSFLTGERWWGDAPYGGQATDNALIALLASLRAEADQIAGFRICPVVAAVQVPREVSERASRFYWMRRYEGPYWQEIRLMPSNVRLYFHSPITLGVDPARVLQRFRLDSLERCGKFLENLLSSALAATTLLARTLRYDPERAQYTGLDFFEVYLDKDSVVAPDGALYFADLEGVEPFFGRAPQEVRERIVNQYYQNVYEASYAVEAVAREAWRSLGITASASDRSAWIDECLTRALAGDPYLCVERTGSGVGLHIEPAVDAHATSVDVVWTTGEG